MDSSPSSTSSTDFDATSVRPEFAIYPPFNNGFIGIGESSSSGDAIARFLDSIMHISLPEDADEGLSQPIDSFVHNMMLMLPSITAAETAPSIYTKYFAPSSPSDESLQAVNNVEITISSPAAEMLPSEGTHKVEMNKKTKQKKAFSKYFLNLVKVEVQKYELEHGTIVLPSHYEAIPSTQLDASAVKCFSASSEPAEPRPSTAEKKKWFADTTDFINEAANNKYGRKQSTLGPYLKIDDMEKSAASKPKNKSKKTARKEAKEERANKLGKTNTQLKTNHSTKSASIQKLDPHREIILKPQYHQNQPSNRGKQLLFSSNGITELN